MTALSIVKGIGTVVTGCVKSGSIKIDNHAVISRTAGSIKVKGIRIDKDETAAISLNQRAALNIDTGLENVSRGDWLLDHSILHPVTRLDANVILIDPEASLKTERISFYIGAAHHVVSLRQLSESDMFSKLRHNLPSLLITVTDSFSEIQHHNIQLVVVK